MTYCYYVDITLTSEYGNEVDNQHETKKAKIVITENLFMFAVLCCVYVVT